MGDKIAILEFNKHLCIFFYKESGILPMIKTKMAYWQVLNLMHAWSLNIIVSALQIIKISANTLVSSIFSYNQERLVLFKHYRYF